MDAEIDRQEDELPPLSDPVGDPLDEDSPLGDRL